MRNWLIGLLLAATALFAGWYFASPVYAMNALRDAAQSGEEAALESSVDFPVLRENLKTELRGRMADGLDGVAGGELGRFGSALGMAVVDPMIDGLVTPEAIATIVRQGDVIRSSTDNPQSGTSKADWSIERSGLSRFTARPSQGEAALVFERRGLGWKLVGIDLPAS